MSARRGHLAAVPGEGARLPRELVTERPRILASVGICQRCNGSVRSPVDTHYGLLVFEAEAVPLTPALINSGQAYLMWRGEGDMTLIVRANDVPRGAYTDVDTALTPHVCTSILDSQGTTK